MLADERADVESSPQAIERAVAGGEVESRTEMRTKALRVRARQQRCGFKDVAVDQPKRSGIVLVANGMKQQRAVHAVYRDADVRRTETANGKLGAEVVARRNGGQHLRSAKRIVGNQPAQREQIAAAQYRLRRDAWLRFAKWTRGHGHVFDVGARALSDRDRDVGILSRNDRHVAPNQTVSDNGDEECLWAGRHINDLETAVAVGERLLIRSIGL